MTTFYLQQHEESGRWLIDSTFPLNAHGVADSRDASEWLEAKRSFGYPLSPVQERLLETPLADRLKALKEGLGS
jgi:hypothetical protein